MYLLKLVDIKRKQAKPRSLFFEIPFVVVIDRFFFPQLPALFPPGRGYFASLARFFVYPPLLFLLMVLVFRFSAIATGKPRCKLHNSNF
jgi:hypothetical protein